MEKVLLLNQAELAESVPLDAAAVECIENAFRILATEAVVMPPILQLDIRSSNGEICVKTAYLPGVDSVAVKISPGFFDNPKIGLPSGSGMMNVFSSKTGILQAVLLDKGYLTDIRTAAAGAVAAKWLSRQNSQTITVLGAGSQARLQIMALRLVRDVCNIRIWARNPSSAETFAAGVQKETGIPTEIFSDVAKACAGADIIVTTTPSETPLLHFRDLQPGQHITAMGSDAERKNEIAPDIIVNADRYVCDRLSQVRVLGELHHAIAAGLVNADQSCDELGQIIAGQAAGRESAQQITLCDLTGTGAQDTAIAAMALKMASARQAGIWL